jgi:hypothetical protein
MPVVYLSVFFFLTFLFLLGLSKRILQPDVKTLLKDDTRKHVLLLRPFTADETTISSSARYGRFYEELLVNALSHIGPVIAVGRPGERLPPSGASRLYVPNEEWQGTVSHLMSSAGLVVLFLFAGTPKKTGATSTGFTWEIDQAIKILQPQQLLLMLPRGAVILKSGGYYQFLSTKRKSRAYLRSSHGYFERLNQVLPQSLPPEAGAADYVYFTPDWSPRLLRARKFQGLNSTLEPFFLARGIKLPKERWWFYVHDFRTIMFVIYLLWFYFWPIFFWSYLK